MTGERFERLLRSSATYTAKNRSMILHVQVVLLVIGLAFFVLGLAGLGDMSPDTWGVKAYAAPAWAWGAVNATAATLSIWGLVHPPKPRLIAIGAVIHIIQFAAISVSALFYGGDNGVGIWAAGLTALHIKIGLEAMREVDCRWKTN